jgi:hypothetical protein
VRGHHEYRRLGCRQRVGLRRFERQLREQFGERVDEWRIERVDERRVERVDERRVERVDEWFVQRSFERWGRWRSCAGPSSNR